MKKTNGFISAIVIILWLIFFNQPGFGQTDIAAISEKNSYNQEVSMNIFSVRTIAGIYAPVVSSHNLYFTAGSGFLLKKFFNRHSGIRITLDYSQKSFSEDYFFSYNPDKNIGKYQLLSIRMGYEHIFLNKNLSPFWCVDFIGGYGSVKGTIVRKNGNLENYNNEIKEAGIDIGLGLRYKPTAQSVISIELPNIDWLAVSGEYGKRDVRFNFVRTFSFGLLF